jgi:hypothetical protein
MVPSVGHVFVPALIQMLNCVLGEGKGKAPNISRKRDESWRTERKGLYPGWGARVRRDG